jgi:hypothetical protein
LFDLIDLAGEVAIAMRRDRDEVFGAATSAVKALGSDAAGINCTHNRFAPSSSECAALCFFGKPVVDKSQIAAGAGLDCGIAARRLSAGRGAV